MQSPAGVGKARSILSAAKPPLFENIYVALCFARLRLKAPVAPSKLEVWENATWGACCVPETKPEFPYFVRGPASSERSSESKYCLHVGTNPHKPNCLTSRTFKEVIQPWWSQRLTGIGSACAWKAAVPKTRGCFVVMYRS